jgi:hypothetical protein
MKPKNVTMGIKSLRDGLYRAAVITKRRIEIGKSKTISSEELWGRLGLH